jgi:predicted PP-loop superfamily ATPase
VNNINKWKITFDESGGYDCMTAAIICGNVVLDGSNYGQKPCEKLSKSIKNEMFADAYLITASQEMLEVLETILTDVELTQELHDRIESLITKATNGLI